MSKLAWSISGFWLGTVLALTSCSRNESPATPVTPSAPSTASASAVESEPTPPPLSLVHASAVVRDCPDAKWMHTRAAQRSIQKLIDPCIAVPGGKAHFSATLVPGGRLSLASPSGNADEGIVPTCVLKDQNLRHQVFLKHPCSFDVVLEERSEPAPSVSQPDLPPDSSSDSRPAAAPAHEKGRKR